MDVIGNKYEEAYSQYFTKEQLKILLYNWNAEGQFPTKKNDTVVAFPNTDAFPLIIVSWTDQVSDYKKRLYSCKFYKAVGG